MELEKKGLNRDIIKCIGMLTMLLNHIAHALLTEGTLVYDICIGVGYFTAITMCYFLVEGYEYTRSKKKYALRLLVFGLLSQVPFTLLFQVPSLNMLFSLLICFGMLCILDKFEGRWYRELLVVLLFLVSAFSDWPLMAPAFTLLFRWSNKNRIKLLISYGISIAIFCFLNGPGHLVTESIGRAVLHTALEALALVASALVILFFYNGKKATVAPKFFKWFFYLFYPVHLTVLYVLTLVL